MPVAVGFAAAGVFALVRASLVDDAHITLSYARNLAFDLHWGLTGVQTSNTATSPLNVILLAAATFVVRDPMLALGAVFVLCTTSTALALRRLCRLEGLPEWVPLVAVCLVLVNPLLVASVGLEVALGTAGIMWLLVFARQARPVAFGVFAGLLVLVRIDLVVVVAVVFLARRRWWAGWWRSLLAAALVALPWFAWSWVVLGSAVPDTLVIKLAQSAWGKWTFTNGPLLYLGSYQVATVLAFVPAVLGVLAAAAWLVLRIVRPGQSVRRLDAFAPLALASVLYYLAYSGLRVPPYHWYYGPSVAMATVFFVAAVGCLARAPMRLPARAVGTGAVLALLVASAGFDVRHVLSNDHLPITTNHASSVQYKRIGLDLAALARHKDVRTAGEIGVLAFYCGCSVVDIFSDRGEIEPLIEAGKRRFGPVVDRLVDLNFLFLHRGLSPRRPELALVRTTGSVPREAMAAWPVDSPWSGKATLFLVPTGAVGSNGEPQR